MQIMCLYLNDRDTFVVIYIVGDIITKWIITLTVLTYSSFSEIDISVELKIYITILLLTTYNISES